MKLLLTTCLLFVLLPAVTTLNCEQCSTLPGFHSCLYPRPVECEKHEDSCIREVSFTYIKGERVMTGYMKKCVDSKSWLNGSYKFDAVGDVNIIGTIELCQTDLCNNQEHHPLRPSDVEENGRTCPTCIALGSHDCEAQQTISCRGEEIKCLYTSGIAAGSEGAEYFALQGCATPNLCNIQKEGIFGGIITHIRRLKCTNASMSPSALEGPAPHLLASLPFMGMKQRPQGPGN